MASKEKKVTIRLQEKGAAQTKRSIGGVESSIGSMTKSIVTGAASFYALQKAGKLVFDSLDKTSKLQDLTKAFQNLAKAQKLNADVMLKEMTKATAGTVTEIDLLQQANNALLLDLPVTEKDMGLLAQAGRTLGKAMGIDAKQGLESLVVGIGRQSKLWLDNLGILVDTEKAYNNYAIQINKTAKDLTDAEKKQAFFNATMESVRSKMKDLGPTQETFSDNIERIKVWADKASTSFGTFISEIFKSDIQKQIDQMKEYGTSIKNVNKAVETKNLFELGNKLIDQRKELNNTLNEANKYFEKHGLALKINNMGFEEYNKLQAESEKLQKRISDASVKEFDVMMAQKEAGVDVSNTTRDYTKALKEKKNIIDKLISNFDTMIELEDEIQAIKTPFSDIGNSTGVIASNTNLIKENLKEILNLSTNFDANLTIEQKIHNAIMRDMQDNKNNYEDLTNYALSFLGYTKNTKKETKEIVNNVSSFTDKLYSSVNAVNIIYSSIERLTGLFDKSITKWQFKDFLNAGMSGLGIFSGIKGLGFAGGVSNLKVPPGYENDTFGPMFASTDEVINITPASQTTNTSNSNLTVNVYGNYTDVDRLAQEIADRSKLGFNRIATNA